MKKLVLVLYIVILLILAIATFVEYGWGSKFVAEHIYHSPFFCLLWCILALSVLAIGYRKRLWHQISSRLLHLSFVVILLGAGISYLTSKKGMIHLRIGQQTFRFMEQEEGLMLDLPFTLSLDTFYVEYYPGTEAPSDYVSVVRCSVLKDGNQPVTISMNRVFDCQRYRFYQASYDEDGGGTVLSVNYDPWGTGVTYVGYMLFALSMLGVWLGKAGEFRRLLRHPLLKMWVVFSCMTMTVEAKTSHELPIISIAEADSLSATQVIYHDRVVPFNTLALDFVRKLSGKETFEGLTAEQVVGSWQKYPEAWKHVPIIRIKNDELCRLLGLETNDARLIDLFDNNEYRLREWWHSEKRHGGKLSTFEKAILETDEKVALIGMLQEGTLIRPLPTDGSVSMLSPTQLKTELLYNRIPFNKVLFMVCLTFGFLSFGWFLAVCLKGEGTNRIKFRKIECLLSLVLIVAFLFHLCGYLLRWYIGGRIPLSNGYETMQFLALCLLGLAVCLHRRFFFVLPFAFLLSGFVLLVAHLGQMNPQITPLIPVLLSPWLSIHVSFIMMSYALFAFMLLNGLLAFCLPHDAEQLMVFSKVLLYPAVFLLGAGIFMGAVWANVSWGRYWAWDPKEVWALITFMVYAMPFHSNSLTCFRRPFFFHMYLMLAFLTVLMTYFGVNFFLGGMHSYA